MSSTPDTFTLDAATTVALDAQTNNANLRWSLAGPSGAIVANRAFTATDGSALAGTPALRLPAAHRPSLRGGSDPTAALDR